MTYQRHIEMTEQGQDYFLRAVAAVKQASEDGETAEGFMKRVVERAKQEMQDEVMQSIYGPQGEEV